MGKKLHIGNLPYSATEEVLSQMFSQCGSVESAKVIMDRDSGRSKGFAFIEMSSEAEAQAAISQMNGQDCEGRAITVGEARPMAPREGGGRTTSGRSGRGGRSGW